MESVYENKNECSGCLACLHKCPVEAITAVEDELGFIYPQIDQSTCIDCMLCKQICPWNDDYDISDKFILFNNVYPHLYACKNNDVDVLNNSTSGGMFTALSDYILEKNGSVYGVTFDKHFNVTHSRATNKRDRDAMRFSKYVQTDLSYIYSLIESDLKHGMKVMFTGTPCQCAGIKEYFQMDKNKDNLFLVDLICHSIPSPKIWNDFKAMLETEQDGKLQHVQFRSKVHPWLRNNSNKGFMYKINDVEHEDDRFYRIFTQDAYSVRDSCFNCQFSSTARVGDLTIADYWGIEDYAKDLYDEKGVSSVFANNKKGEVLLRKVQPDITCAPRNLKEQVSTQGRLTSPVEKPLDYDVFIDIYQDKGLAAAYTYLQNKKEASN